ncbi:MAG: hypothetical protein ACKVK4_09905, partial [Flavobacteriales bacterium]
MTFSIPLAPVGCKKNKCVAAKGWLQGRDHTLAFVQWQFHFLSFLFAANFSLSSRFFGLLVTRYMENKLPVYRSLVPDNRNFCSRLYLKYNEINYKDALDYFG